MKRVFLDTNVLLDVLLQRSDFYATSSAVWKLSEAGRLSGVISSLSVNTVAYLVRKHVSAVQARALARDLITLFDVAAVDHKTLGIALAGSISDVEDAIQEAAAVAANCEAIVTRNVPDFRRSRIPVMTPAELLELLKHQP